MPAVDDWTGCADCRRIVLLRAEARRLRHRRDHWRRRALVQDAGWITAIVLGLVAVVALAR